MSSGSYLVELDRWNIKNNGSDAVNTSKGINSAIVWASQEGYSEVVLPDGTYLIDENNPVIPQSFMTFNLGGATLRIRDNSLPKYAIVLFHQKQQYSRITNGKIEGDRYTHTYTTGSTHEFGIGVELRNGVEYITIDNLEIFNTTGDAIIGITSFGGIGGGFPQLGGNFEAGGINTSNGSLTSDTNRIRSKIKIPMVPQITNLGRFGLYGDSYGGIGKEITTNTYDVVFYKSDDTFLASAKDLHFFDEVEVPTGASYAKVVLHQATVPSISGNTIVIRTPEFPKHVYIEKCNLHHCRRLGIAICGMKHCYVNGCEIHHISGTAPQGAIDIEDGYDLNQYIFIDGNNIYDNQSYNIIAVAGKHISITNNRIRSGIFTINSGVDKAIVENNYFHDCGPRLTGDTLFSNNHLYNCRLLLLGNGEAKINNSHFHNSPINFGKEKAYVAQIDNCKFLYDEDFYGASINPGAPLIFSTEPQSISDSIFEGSGKEAFTTVPVGAHDWILDNVSFINIKHKENRITPLPPGVYNGCKFINSGRLCDRSGEAFSKYEFNNCYFEWDSYTLFYMGPSQKVDFFKVSNCYFYNPVGYDSAFFLNGNWGNLYLKENTFYYPNGNRYFMIDIRNTTVADSVQIIGNTFIANHSMISVNADKSPNIPLIFKDNHLLKSQINLHDFHLLLNNLIDNELDPYYTRNTEPTSGFYRLGQQIKNSSPKPGSYIGWVNTSEGMVNNIPWKPNTAYKVNALVNANGKVYKAMEAGTSGATAPSHTTGSALDGSVRWEYVNTLAAFKPFGQISN
ncbi:right-handed parallel beta-helix repeat-containing protein [Bacillus sp. FJAT-50079]|uniref:right-handed parallel beta-helix repeat-containing protein n=1 Tax=Bacillus sp. FJAT-50079 TaxID=2833577 RepID=UPI001BCA14A6|nr:right-handed parallel beta-helix repeat-containing protein [Bacillus sp. FJAT-50079]MBS4209144.1 right-handed parallel beta-helix repeat-containing protein [Bacillus sp. FJAT-50079]